MFVLIYSRAERLMGRGGVSLLDFLPPVALGKRSSAFLLPALWIQETDTQ